MAASPAITALPSTPRAVTVAASMWDPPGRARWAGSDVGGGRRAVLVADDTREQTLQEGADRGDPGGADGLPEGDVHHVGWAGRQGDTAAGDEERPYDALGEVL